MEPIEYKIYKPVFKQFIDRFNRMCQEYGLTYIIRKHTYYYETGSVTRDKRYKVKYKYKNRGMNWEIYAVPTFWFSFKKFPLLKITFSDKISVSGIGVNAVENSTMEKTPQNLENFFDEYIQQMKQISPAVFAHL